jgi:putative FmdB family regulatory protein
MPLYDFLCKSCDLVFEDLIKASDINPSCPQCKGETARLISPCNGVVIGSEHRPLDCVIGADSEKRWNFIEKRKKDRLLKHQGANNVHHS